ncbi:hypothetical protein [Azotosporobacter soli]|uniref:hypothetical protein n=1 Tax=Azotosporobacter soli TaxID=3055040 RepID=UPI0031FE5A18
MKIGFVALETFVPTKKYLEWSKLFQVEEVVSLDCALCPRIVRELPEDDNGEYQHEYGEVFTDIFSNLDWLLNKTRDLEDKQILAVVKEPKEDCARSIHLEGFQFCGYDLVEDATRISALTNCGGFDKAFLASDLSRYGLIEDFAKAKEIQIRLREYYPNEEHADTTRWAIWKMFIK